MTTTMKQRTALTITALLIAALSTVRPSAQTQKDAELLRVREEVWRAWFTGDTQRLAALVPPETIVISAGEQQWKNQADVIRTALDFHRQGGKLVRLEFPRTEVQHFGDVAIVWSRYVVETELEGTRSSSSGRVTEIFVWQRGRWTNPGWHTDEEK